MPLMTCSDCKKEHSDSAPACPHCGRPNRQAPAPAPAVTPEFLRPLGLLLFLGGIAGLGYFMVSFDTSVAVPSVEVLGQHIGGGRVHNIGLMQERQNGLWLSAAASALGLLALFAANRGRSS